MRWGPSGGGPSPAAGPRGLPPLLPRPRAAARLLTDVSALSPQLTTLRGAILEDAIPSTARHGTARGLPLREVLEYLVPELSTQCLRQAPSSPRVAEQLLRLDEQGVCAAPSSPSPSRTTACLESRDAFSPWLLPDVPVRSLGDPTSFCWGAPPLCCDRCRFTKVRCVPARRTGQTRADEASGAFLPGLKTLTLSLSVNYRSFPVAVREAAGSQAGVNSVRLEHCSPDLVGPQAMGTLRGGAPRPLL